MARTWLSISVELLAGGGTAPWPIPGRTFAVGPSHTFAYFADAINTAFARWDLAHLSEFTFADGSVITDVETGMELLNGVIGSIQMPLDIARTKVASRVKPGDEFRFIFGLDDRWVHRCIVHEEKVDPLDMLGIVPRVPLPYWGWGSIPDQYGRRWPDDDGERPMPPAPGRWDPMVFEWPPPEQLPVLDMGEVRRAVAAGDADVLIATINGRNIDDALQQIGVGARILLQRGRDEDQALALSIANRLTYRAWPGDGELSADLLAHLRGEDLVGRAIRIDLDMLTMLLDESPEFVRGAYVDLRSGEVFDGAQTDSALIGEDLVVDVEADPERYLWLERTDAHDGWNDMAAFAAQLPEADLRDRLDAALQGKGAFRRFQEAVHDVGLEARWHTFRTDRQLGRARERLAAEGIRAI